MINEFPPNFESDIKNIAIDFDGVIHTNDRGWYDGTCYGEPIEGSVDAIKKLSNKFRVIIFTAKSKSDRPLINDKTGTELVWEWLEKYNLDKYIYKVISEKPRAQLYIDDKGYRFENWKDTLNYVEELL